MYTNQALWTQAREGLDVTTVIYSNGRYGILTTECERLGFHAMSSKGSRLFQLDAPQLDWVALAKGMGVPAVQVSDCAQFAEALRRSFAEPGPFLIDAKLP